MPQAPATPMQIDAALGVARLHAGLAIDAVVEHDDGEIARPLDADGGERAQPHQHLAVAGDDRDALCGCASARPSPIMAAPPMAPHR